MRNRYALAAITIILSVWTFGAPAQPPATPPLFSVASADRPAVIVDAAQSPLSARCAARLADYIEQCVGSRPAIEGDHSKTTDQTMIILGGTELEARFNLEPSIASDSPEAYALHAIAGPPARVFAVGRTDRGIKRAIQRLILLSEQAPGSLSLAETHESRAPWKPVREYMLVNWSPDEVRTKFYNQHVNKRLDVVYRYSDQQTRDYVAMLDELGFSGVQLGESSVSWSMSGSKEAYQDRIRRVARAAHDWGQSVSYLFWAAEFNVGWIDPEMVYEPAPGKTAFQDERIRRGFEKYYDHYAKLAPDVDMVFAHWFDAGRLENLDDVIEYQKLLREKMLAINPRLRFGINTWGRAGFMEKLLEAGMRDFVLLEISLPDLVSQEQRIEFRKKARDNGFEVGVWGWYMTEMESDQAANMHVNGHVLKEYINNMRNGAEQVLPASYWSEMEAIHLANIYTMYQASQLLWDPDADPDQLLREIALAVWGPRDGPEVLKALHLIEDTRTGRNWAEYSYNSPGRRDGTENPAEDARRAADCLAALAARQPDPGFVPKITLPVDRREMLLILLPHLEQIRRFAEFRIEFDRIKEMYRNGADKSAIRDSLAAAWKPIPDFDAWIGIYGQAEAWRQSVLIRKFCEESEIEMPLPPGWVISRDAWRALQKFESQQRVRIDPSLSDVDEIANEFHLDKGYAGLLMRRLVDEGWMEPVENDRYRLVNWKDIAFPARLRMGTTD